MEGEKDTVSQSCAVVEYLHCIHAIPQISILFSPFIASCDKLK